jgi:hypothetical protein
MHIAIWCSKFDSSHIAAWSALVLKLKAIYGDELVVSTNYRAQFQSLVNCFGLKIDTYLDGSETMYVIRPSSDESVELIDKLEEKYGFQIRYIDVFPDHTEDESDWWEKLSFDDFNSLDRKQEWPSNFSPYAKYNSIEMPWHIIEPTMTTEYSPNAFEWTLLI